MMLAPPYETTVFRRFFFNFNLSRVKVHVREQENYPLVPVSLSSLATQIKYAAKLNQRRPDS